MQLSTIAVFGGSGFLGRYVVRHLAAAGYQVRSFSRHPSRDTFLKTAGNVGQIVCDYADLSKPNSYKGKLKGADAVINLVGILYESASQRFAEVQAMGAKSLAEEAKVAGVSHFIHVSALGVENSPHSAYAKSKLAAEASIRSLYPAVTIFRPSVIFGKEDNFYNQFAKVSVLSPALPLIGGGKTLFQPTYVDDVAQAIVKVLSLPEAAGKTYELGGPETLSFKEILQSNARMTGHRPALVPLPFFIAKLMGGCLQFKARFLPFTPPLTADQVELLKSDNVVGADSLGYAALGIVPESPSAIVPTYLSRYNKKGL